MTNVKKFMRSITAIALIFTMFFSIVSIPVFAAGGVETWNKGTVTYEPFIINPYNLTPVKTIGSSGRLVVTAKFDIEDNSSYSNAVKCTLQIRDIYGNVLDTNTMSTHSYTSIWCDLNVTQGQKIQIYTSVYDAVTGENRYAKLTYGYTLR